MILLKALASQKEIKTGLILVKVNAIFKQVGDIIGFNIGFQQSISIYVIKWGIQK